METADRWLFGLSVATVAAVLVSIAAAQILFTITLVGWVVLRSRPVNWPGWMAPALAFMAATVLSLAMSPEPELGLAQVKKFVLFPIGLVGASFIRDEKRLRVVVTACLGVAGASAALGCVQFLLQYREFLSTGALADDPMILARTTGFMSHWMTFSGEQMLVWAMAVPLVWMWRSRLYWVLLSLVAAGILLGFTRSVWVGTAASIAVTAFYLPPRLLVRMVIPVVIVGIVGSGFVVTRVARSFLDEDFAPDSARIEMLEVGARMIADHPFFGVGPERVRFEFPEYYEGESLERFYYYHLHNNFLQIAAERGLPAAIALLWLMARLGFDLVGFTRSPEPWVRWPAVAGLAVLGAFMVEGLFEYNIGDSEMLMLFLFLVSVPYGMARGNRDIPPVDDSSSSMEAAA